MIGQRRMRRGAAREWPPTVAARGRHAAIGDDAADAGRQLERQAAGMGVVADAGRRRGGGGDDRGVAGGGGGPVSMITVVWPASRRWKPVCGMFAIGVPWVSS